MSTKKTTKTSKTVTPEVPGDDHPAVGKHCVVRTYSAGVHAGLVLGVRGTEVCLKDSRRIWRWAGAFTLSEVSQLGISKSGSRVAMSVPLLWLTEAVEIVPTTEKARVAIEACDDKG